MPLRRCVAILLAGSVTAFPAAAAELSNLDSGLPNSLDDAFALRVGRIELQGTARYDRLPAGRDAVLLLPRVQVGLAEGLQADVALPYLTGSGRQTDLTDPVAGALYNVNRERGWLPALALSVDYTGTVGSGRRSAELGFTAIATKTITASVERRLHLNLSWLRALNPDEDERRNRYRAVVGYSQLVAPKLVLVTDYLREQGGTHERDSNILEAGLRFQVSDALTLGAGLGAGIGRDSPRFRGIFSIQLGFGGR